LIPVIGADHELVEITFEIDGHKSGHHPGLLGDNDGGVRHQVVSPALAPPRQACHEIDSGIGVLPDPQPKAMAACSSSAR